MAESIIWASLILYLLWRLEVNYRNWVKNQEPLADKQYKELKDRIDQLQSHVNGLIINSKDYE